MPAKTTNTLKEVRESLELTQEQVAETFRAKYKKESITAQHISKWERAAVDPSLDYALILSDILQKPVNELFKRR